jgi:hypothetical protein
MDSVGKWSKARAARPWRVTIQSWAACVLRARATAGRRAARQPPPSVPAVRLPASAVLLKPRPSL